MSDIDVRLQKLAEVGIALSTEMDLDHLFEKTILEAKEITNSDGGILYLLNEEDDKLKIVFIFNEQLGLAAGGATNVEVLYPAVDLYDTATGNPRAYDPIVECALSGKTINIADAYEVSKFDFSSVKENDDNIGYRSKSFLYIPLKNRKKKVIGVVQLINSRNEFGSLVEFDEGTQKLAEAISANASIALDNQGLVRELQTIFEAFVKIIAKSIDAKSPHTGAHCQRVPEIVLKLAMAACLEDDGPFANFGLDDDDWTTLQLASWLHDCGKIATPEYIVDKATKLETVNNRIHEVRTRFEVLRRDAEIAYLKKQLEGNEDKEKLKKEFEDEVAELEGDYKFIADCNVGFTAMRTDDRKRLALISRKKWIRHFDRLLGLSWEEATRTNKEIAEQVPAEEFLLDNRSEHNFAGYNRGEVYNLSVVRGTLTPEERKTIDAHIDVTIDMLAALPFPDNLKNIPEYACGHHERIDGKGYPKGLTGKQMSIPARIMAIADIFEALTATDRPYKAIKSLSKVVDIMANMKDTGHIDPDLFNLFLASGVHQVYAEQYMLPEQIDEVDINKYL
ncbi:MAG: GAF domain-containing protein [Alphaproteobacteria bacterium]|nr:GAF domain-containing protein [Alphaproteobacteria bacterium]